MQVSAVHSFIEEPNTNSEHAETGDVERVLNFAFFDPDQEICAAVVESEDDDEFLLPKNHRWCKEGCSDTKCAQRKAELKEVATRYLGSKATDPDRLAAEINALEESLFGLDFIPGPSYKDPRRTAPPTPPSGSDGVP